MILFQVCSTIQYFLHDNVLYNNTHVYVHIRDKGSYFSMRKWYSRNFATRRMAHPAYTYCLVVVWQKGDLSGRLAFSACKAWSNPAISHRLFRAVLILSPTGNTTRMLSVLKLILAATTGNKFVLDSPRSFFSYTEVARTRRRSNLWHLQLANCTWSRNLIVWPTAFYLLMFLHHLHVPSWAFLSIIISIQYRQNDKMCNNNYYWCNWCIAIILFITVNDNIVRKRYMWLYNNIVFM